MPKKLLTAPSLFERCHKFQKMWEYIDDPTFSRSISSHVCLTCSKFDYSNPEGSYSILSCNCHKKLIWHGHHLTHSCEFYKKKTNFGIQKSLNQINEAA